MIRIFLSFLFCFSFFLGIAQPTAVPAFGYQWVKTGNAEYYSSLISTVPNITNGSTSFGLMDIDPTDCSTSCGGKCDGIPTYAVSLYGISSTTPVGTNSNCEQRAIKINQWPNDFLDAGVTNGSTTGKVYLPTTAKVTIKKSTAPTSPGCGAGSGNNKGKIYGGNGPGNTTKVNVVCNYDISWHSAAFGGIISGGQNWTQNGSFTGNEPGSGLFSAYANWMATDFGNTITSDSIYNIPVANISQTGGSFEIVVTSSPSISVTREYGNADAFAESEPGMEGLADYRVGYEIWEIQQNLPLKLADFIVKLIANDKIQLSWINFSEFNNDKYIVERSYDGRNWQIAGAVSAIENAPGSKAQYTFIDNRFETGKKNIFYRLKLIEKTGTIVYSNQLLIRNGKQTKLSLIPTGSKNEYRLISNTNSKYLINVINVAGQLVKQINLAGITANTTISLVGLFSGVYTIMIQNTVEKEVSRVFLQ
jgi:hypothetical protein